MSIRLIRAKKALPKPVKTTEKTRVRNDGNETTGRDSSVTYLLLISFCFFRLFLFAVGISLWSRRTSRI